MQLIGMYDSPFVRRVAIALKLWGIAFEHRPWSVFRDAAQVARFNPLIRVPTLMLDDGETLFDSSAIIDALDDIVGPTRAMMPGEGVERRKHLRVCALACGLGDKVVSLIYERAVHQRESPDWIARCNAQIDATLDVLERECRANGSMWWFGEALGHADIAVVCMLTLAIEALQFDLNAKRWPALRAHREKCEARPEFREISQPFFAPPPKRVK
jgi:glutathione S-transferase